MTAISVGQAEAQPAVFFRDRHRLDAEIGTLDPIGAQEGAVPVAGNHVPAQSLPGKLDGSLLKLRLIRRQIPVQQRQGLLKFIAQGQRCDGRHRTLELELCIKHQPGDS